MYPPPLTQNVAQFGVCATEAVGTYAVAKTPKASPDTASPNARLTKNPRFTVQTLPLVVSMGQRPHMKTIAYTGFPPAARNYGSALIWGYWVSKPG